MKWAVAGLAVGALTIAYVFVWALCRAAADADRSTARHLEQERAS